MNTEQSYENVAPGATAPNLHTSSVWLKVSIFLSAGSDFCENYQCLADRRDKVVELAVRRAIEGNDLEIIASLLKEFDSLTDDMDDMVFKLNDLIDAHHFTPKSAEEIAQQDSTQERYLAAYTNKLQGYLDKRKGGASC